MPIRVTPTPFGKAASQALHDAVARAKERDALAPVTVVVPTNSVGVSARRRLASGELGRVTPNARGVVGVTFLTVYRLAELLGAARLAAAHRRPVSTPVVASAVRAALASDPGLFAPVAQHPATEEALVGAYRELSDLDAAQLDLLAAQHPRTRDVVRLHRAGRARLVRDWYDEHDLMQEAVAAVRAGTRLVGDLGVVICFLPQRWSPPAALLLRVLAERSEIEIIAGVTGAAAADEQVGRSLARVGASLEEDVARIQPAAATEVWDASDPDDEVRTIVRGVVDAMRAGVELERMAVLYASDEPYARLLHEHFDLASIAHNGATTRSMSESVLGRGLLRLLSLPDNEFARDDVCALFAAAPVLDGRGRRVPAARWERLSRRAGVVRGAEQWSDRLAAYATELDGAKRADDCAQVEALGTFVATLAADLDPGRIPRSWSGLARLAHGLVRRFFGNETRREAWPAFEQVAARRVEAVLDRLSTLDAIDREPGIDGFRRTFELELDAARDRVGHLGDGVLVGPVGMALGVDLDRLWVCGLAEGLFPAVPRDDPLLGDRERAVLDGALRLRSDRTTDDQRAFLAALASTEGARVCTYPRGDLRRSTERVPSRFLAERAFAVGAMRSIPSYAFGSTNVAFPANRHELDVRAAVAGEPWVRSEPAVAVGLELAAGRASAQFTRFDGNLTGIADRLEPISPSVPGRVTSPTRLQGWAICPHAYFMQTVLHVEPVEEPEDIMQLAPIDRGSLVHEVLDRFLDESLGRADAGRPWTEADRARLREIAAEVGAAVEARGLTGRRLLWHRDRRAIFAELDAFLDADEVYRADGIEETLATELAFGFADDGGGVVVVGAVEVPLGGGRAINVRGKADRVDRRPDGRLVVIDYKTGSERHYRGLTRDDPLTAGRHLQLPVYAHAARAAFGAPSTPVEAYYWFVGRGGNERFGYEVDAPIDEVFVDTIRTIVDGIEGGVFPARPDEPAPTPFITCHYCDPDGMGTTDRWREWERKVDAPELAGLLGLSGAHADADVDAVSDQLALFPPPGDAAARAAVGSQLGETLFVEAGAGTGKTKVLVDRVVALVTSDGDDLPVPISAVAAITFTEKAAAELRDRVRRELRRRAGDELESETVRARCRQALDDLDAAAICTLHSFAQRILTEFPIEVGLPPRIEVRDEISSRLAFDTRWRVFVDEMLDDADLEPTVLSLLAAGVRLTHLRRVAEVLDDNWDLLDRVGAAPALPELRIDDWLDHLDAACSVGAHCRVDDDKLLLRLAELAEYAGRLRRAVDDSQRIELLLAAKPSFAVTRVGSKKNWPDIEGVRDPIVKLGEQRKAMTDAVIDVAIRRAVAAITVYVADAVAQRRVSGELDFHDLLVLARTLLRDPEHGPGARERLRRRYRRILIDEFQDTDPIQVELAALLGSSDPGAGARPWNETTVDDGRLFFVGDPKQSIYRFRRADIATFLAARDRFARPAPQFLTCNFRSAPRVLEWVNHVFGELIQPYESSQPEYRPLEAGRSVPAGPGAGHEVVLLGIEPHADAGVDAAELRAHEAVEVAAIARAAVAQAWPVFDTEHEAWRPARLGDICILLPARTSLGYLEQALGDAGIPYRAETSSLVYSSREVRDLLMTLRAVDDSTNALALVSALRSSLFGCGDDDLYAFHVEHDGRWNISAPLPDTLPVGDPVGAAMRFLGELHAARLWSTPSELLERIVRERGVIEVGALSGRFRDVARRVRFVVDQARAYADAVGGTLRDYVRWAELQGAEGARVVEAVLPETDDDAVRIMTIHGAKGLEFPIVVCSGMTTEAQTATRGVEVLFPPAGGCEVKIVKGVQTAEFELHKPIDEQMGFHEKLRLLYVAATRARDHLVVSVHRKARALDPGQRPRWTHAELVWEASAGAPWITAGPAPAARAAPEARPAEAAAPPLDPAAWQEEYDRVLRRSDRRGFVSATTLAHRLDPGSAFVDGAATIGDPGLAKNARDLELPPWNKGRYGTAIGRAVHGTLQTVDLATGDGVAPTSAAQAAAEGVLGHEVTIEALTRSALASPTVMRAATRPHWRETYVAVPFEGITLEGYVDLVFRDDDGLVVVDYKTDAVDAETRSRRVVQYRIQAAAYALAITEATGETVRRGVLCFLDASGASEVTFAGAELTAAVAEVRALLAAERDDPSPRPPPVPSEV